MVAAVAVDMIEVLSAVDCEAVGWGVLIVLLYALDY